jgi:hypothetical protein
LPLIFFEKNDNKIVFFEKLRKTTLHNSENKTLKQKFFKTIFFTAIRLLICFKNDFIKHKAPICVLYLKEFFVPMISTLICKNETSTIAQDIDIQYFKSIKLIGEKIWNEAAPSNDIFLQFDYLNLLEDFPPINMTFAYIVFSQGKKTIGVAYFQNSPFDASKSLKNKSYNSNWLSAQLQFQALIVGNALLTGEHGFYFSPSIPKEKQEIYCIKAIEIVQEECEKEGRKPICHLVKDFYEEKDFLTQNAYSSYPFSPSMVLELKENWLTFEDYLLAMQTKYRTRAKRAEKKRGELKKLDFDVQLIENQQDKIFEYYKKIANGADFNYTFLHPNYFLAMKKTFGERFTMTGYYDHNELVGFYTTLQNYDELETGFIGFDDTYNASHQLYLNFLYDMVKIGIEKKVKKIIFSRTALEIKSSIGAEPHQLSTYIKHQNSWFNFFVPTIVKRLSPPQEWTQRKPFKTDSFSNISEAEEPI